MADSAAPPQGANPGDQSVLRNPTVVGTALASLFSDSGHEMATAFLPGFLRSLGSPAAALGTIEGVADAALSVSRMAGGVLSDRPGVERKKMVAAGYLTTGVAYASIGLAGAWPFAAISRAFAWIARGVRTPARESLLAGSVPATHYGRAFGLERAGDSVGAILGPLIAAALIGVIGYRWLFALSFVPAVAAALTVILLVREAPRLHQVGRPGTQRIIGFAKNPGPYRRLWIAAGLYGLGNFSATLLILRATDILADTGHSTAAASSLAVLLYAGHNAANAVFAYPAGRTADRFGHRPVLAMGIALYAAACLAFAIGSSNLFALALLFAAVGASTAMVETTRASYASEVLPSHLRGRGFGFLGLVDGLGDLVSSIVVGVLWTITAPAWGFLYAAGLSAMGALVLLTPTRPRGHTDPPAGTEPQAAP
jgi:MFS family permease